MESARRVMMRVGARNATLRQIAGEARATTGAIYHHFKNQHHVLAAVYADGVAEALREVEDAASDVDGRAPQARVREIVLRILALLSRSRWIVDIGAQARLEDSFDPEARAIIEAADEQLIEQLTELMHVSGLAAPGPAGDSAEALLALLVGLVVTQSRAGAVDEDRTLALMRHALDRWFGTDGDPIAAPAAAPRSAGDEREALVAAVEELYAAGLLTSTGGNVCLRRTGRPDEVWITPGSLPKGELSPETMVRVGLDGEPLDPGSRSPSSERLMHCAILRARPEVQAVVHSHGNRTIALGLAGLPFLPVCAESALVGELPRVPWIMPGSRKLAEAAARALGTGPAVMLLNHGLIVAGSSLRRAVDTSHIVEHTADVLLSCAAADRTPVTLPEGELDKLQKLGRMIA